MSGCSQADDRIRYHATYILIDRRVLYVLSFNFTRLDIDHSRGFDIVTTRANWVREAARLFDADCARTAYMPAKKTDTFVVSPTNSRQVLRTLLRGAKTQLLIYDPRFSDPEMLRIPGERAKGRVEVKVIGSVAGRPGFAVQRLAGMRLHTRTIIRDRRQAFVGSQSLRAAELDSRREVGLIVRDPHIVKKLVETFEADWTSPSVKKAPALPTQTDILDAEPTGAPDQAGMSGTESLTLVETLSTQLDPLVGSVKKAVRRVVAKVGEDVLHEDIVKDALKKVVKKAVKKAVKEAVHDAETAKTGV